MILNPKKLFTRYILKRKFENYEDPGFVTIEIGSGDVGKELRQYFVPEDLLVTLENEIENKYGQEGVEKLYEAGKYYGWEYAEASNIPSYKEVGEKQAGKAISLFMDFLETLYTSKITYNINFDEKIVEKTHHDSIISRKNGKGYLFNCGTSAGFFGSILEEPNLECQKINDKGGSDFDIICAIPEKLEGEPLGRFSDMKTKTGGPRYRKLNKTRTIEGRKSINELKKNGNYKLDAGLLKRDELQLVVFEVGFLYHIEKKMDELGAGEDLFDMGFNFGKPVDVTDERLENILSAAGFGKATINEEEIRFEYFPWHPYFDEVEMKLLRGSLSGLRTSEEGEQHVYSETEKKIEEDKVELIFKK